MLYVLLSVGNSLVNWTIGLNLKFVPRLIPKCSGNGSIYLSSL